MNEKVKNGEKLEITHAEKVDLDYMANYWDNIITEIEREIKKKPNMRAIAFRLNVMLKE